MKQKLTNLTYTDQTPFYPVLKKDWLMLISILILLGLSYWIFVSWQYPKWSERFDLVSAIIGIIPSIPVTILWWKNAKNSWVNNLPSYLNLYLVDEYQGKTTTLVFFEAIPILKNQDIRSQAQTLLKALTKQHPVANLEQFIRPENYEPANVVIDETDKKKQECINKGKPFELHIVTLKLTKPLERKTEEAKLESTSIEIKENHYWYWEPEKTSKPTLEKFPNE